MVQASDAFENPLTVGSGDLSQIRIDILQRPKIRTMPPVAVQCKLRKLDDGMVSGTMLPMPYKNGYVFGVMLPAHTALCYDTTVIRRVLVREFSHAFFKMQLVLESMNRGEASMKDEFNNLDRSADDLRLGDPSRWFSSEGAESLIPHDDGPSRGALEESFLSLVGSPPIIEPRLPHEIQRIGIPDDVCTALNMEVPRILQVLTADSPRPQKSRSKSV